MNELCALTAVEQRTLIDTKEISSVELLNAHLQQIESVNPKLNAIVTLAADSANEAAIAIDARISKGDHPGILAGLPTVHKDLTATAGIRTTYGSRLFKNYVPRVNATIVQRQIDAGAITVGKTNVPEWGAGSQTFNDVFGATANPYDTTKTCGGSSGGAAVALAARMIPLADGSDMGGSLRNPAGFCNVVGFRCSPGLVSNYPAVNGWDTLGTSGPMARTVSDCALFLSAIAGPDPLSPISLNEDPTQFSPPLASQVKGTRVALSPDFNGQLPVQKVVRNTVEGAANLLNELGCEVAVDCPNFAGADDVFKTLRAWSFAGSHASGIKQHPDKYKQTIIWNTQAGLALSGEDISAAQKTRTEIYHRTLAFFEHYDFLVLPTSQVAPFPLEQEYVEEIEGVSMQTYIDWMQASYFITVTGLPVIAIPCGFTPDGLPVGIQIVGKPRSDLQLMKFAYAIEQANPIWKNAPPQI